MSWKTLKAPLAFHGKFNRRFLLIYLVSEVTSTHSILRSFKSRKVKLSFFKSQTFPFYIRIKWEMNLSWEGGEREDENDKFRTTLNRTQIYACHTCNVLHTPFSHSLSLAPYFSLTSRWQQITQLWILIYTQSRALGKSTLQRRECNRQRIKKFSAERNGKKNFFLSPFHDRHEKLNPHRMCVIVQIPASIYSLHFLYCGNFR